MSKTLEYRYDSDTMFHQVVNTMYGFLVNPENEFTSLDLRDAAYFARIKFELEHPRPIIIGRDLSAHIDSLKIRRTKC